ncbi:hypothetical protein QQP08_017526 [Theobroma cacao]|nr:hypothetical protein QQP08_017526 [Theobroma cacao]
MGNQIRQQSQGHKLKNEVAYTMGMQSTTKTSVLSYTDIQNSGMNSKIFLPKKLLVVVLKEKDCIIWIILVLDRQTLNMEPITRKNKFGYGITD